MSAPLPTPPPPRLVSLDAYRGFIMLVMASGGLGFASMVVARERAGEPVSPLLGFLGFQFEHVPWIGCAFWDLIQPSFMFMVGVAMPYSIASREARGDSYGRRILGAAWRALLLVLLAVFLSSPQSLPKGVTTDGPTTQWVFTNVLAQIGLGYLFVYLLAGRGLVVQLVALVAILAATTLAFDLFPLHAPPAEWVAKEPNWVPMTGLFAHWDKNNNVAHFFDVWFLNLFPTVRPFVYNPGGYQTLNFVPSMATMLLGLIAGERLRRPGPNERKLLWLLVMSAVCLAAGLLMGEYVCPIVKRIWTPSWAVYSAGWTFLMLAAFFAVIEIGGWKGWAFPFVVVGMNSIAMYCMSQQLRGWVRRNLDIHVGHWAFAGGYGKLIENVAILGVLWLICLWMYRKRIFLRL
jgi:heparan-alpha-glucosaminide N-acetyltransferase